jgi:hypothetical protein
LKIVFWFIFISKFCYQKPRQLLSGFVFSEKIFDMHPVVRSFDQKFYAQFKKMVQSTAEIIIYLIGENLIIEFL